MTDRSLAAPGQKSASKKEQLRRTRHHRCLCFFEDPLAYNACISHLNGNWKIAQSLLEGRLTGRSTQVVSERSLERMLVVFQIMLKLPGMEGLQLQASEATFTSLIQVYGEGLQWPRICGILEEMGWFKAGKGFGADVACQQIPFSYVSDWLVRLVAPSSFSSLESSRERFTTFGQHRRA